MPGRPPSVIRGLIEAQDHPHLHLPQSVIDELPEPAQNAVANRRSAIETLIQEKSEIVTRVGNKIGLIREKMIREGRDENFVLFRIAGSTQHYHGDGSLIPAEAYHLPGFPTAGGIFGQDEDDRESLVDAVMVAEGLD